MKFLDIVGNPRETLISFSGIAMKYLEIQQYKSQNIAVSALRITSFS